jgi:putative redox protein
MATAIARRREGYVHDVEVAGHKLVMDEPADKGGTDAGPAPTRCVAAALAACTAITVEMYAGRKEWELGDVEVEVEMLGSEGGERSFDVLLRIPTSLDAEQQQRLLQIAGRCPVHRMLDHETEVEVEDRIECQ